MNLIYVFATVFVFLWSYYVNKAYLRCCYERRGYVDDLRRVNRLLYLLPTVCSVITMVALCITMTTYSGTDNGCSTHVFLILTPMCLWVTATFVKTSNIPPEPKSNDTHDTHDLENIRTARKPRQLPIPGRSNTTHGQTVTRHPFAEDPESGSSSQATGRNKEFEMDTLGYARTSYDGGILYEESASDLASVTPLNVETIEEAVAYRRAALTIILFLAMMFMYAILSGSINSDPGFMIESCWIGQLQVLHIIPMAVLFAIISVASTLRAFALPAYTYTIQMCQRASVMCLLCSTLVLVWFSDESLYRKTGGVFLLAMNVFISMTQQIIWGAPYIAGLAGSASAITNQGRPQEQQGVERDSEDGGPRWPVPRHHDRSLVDVRSFSVPSGSGMPVVGEFDTVEGLVPVFPVTIDDPRKHIPNVHQDARDTDREVRSIEDMLRNDDDDEDDDRDIDGWTTIPKPPQVGTTNIHPDVQRSNQPPSVS